MSVRVRSVWEKRVEERDFIIVNNVLRAGEIANGTASSRTFVVFSVDVSKCAALKLIAQSFQNGVTVIVRPRDRNVKLLTPDDLSYAITPTDVKRVSDDSISIEFNDEEVIILKAKITSSLVYWLERCRPTPVEPAQNLIKRSICQQYLKGLGAFRAGLQMELDMILHDPPQQQQQPNYPSHQPPQLNRNPQQNELEHSNDFEDNSSSSGTYGFCAK